MRFNNVSKPASIDEQDSRKIDDTRELTKVAMSIAKYILIVLKKTWAIALKKV